MNPTNDPWFRVVASPIAVGDLVIAPSRVRPMLALRAGGRGDVTASHRAWSFDQGPDIPTPATDGKYLYVVGDKGIVSCLELATGKVVYGPQRIANGTYSASPVLADGKLYVVNEDGLTTVLKAGPAFEVLSENALSDTTLATPAVAGGQIFIRTAKKLYCLGKRT
jgi:outer membrane protein assembly factor BamB